MLLMPHRMLFNDVKPEVTKHLVDLETDLFYNTPLHNIQYGI